MQLSLHLSHSLPSVLFLFLRLSTQLCWRDVKYYSTLEASECGDRGPHDTFKGTRVLLQTGLSLHIDRQAQSQQLI